MPRRVPALVLALAVPVVAIVTVVVTLSATSEPGAGVAAAGGHAITIRSFAFSPTPLRVKAGTTIRVANADGTTHTLTADNGSFDTGNVDGGATATITVPSPGRFTYHCDIHNYMTGTIQVSG